MIVSDINLGTMEELKAYCKTHPLKYLYTHANLRVYEQADGSQPTVWIGRGRHGLSIQVGYGHPAWIHLPQPR